jgi:hypothetical protein
MMREPTLKAGRSLAGGAYLAQALVHRSKRRPLPEFGKIDAQTKELAH